MSFISNYLMYEYACDADNYKQICEKQEKELKKLRRLKKIINDHFGNVSVNYKLDGLIEQYLKVFTKREYDEFLRLLK